MCIRDSPATVDMGDIDHEEFYGSEPPQRNATSIYKGVLTAERNLQEARMNAVSYTHLTPPTRDLVQISVVAVSFKKKKKEDT